MDKYIGLLAIAANKASYRKRPVETLDEVQKLATESANRRVSNKEKRAEKYDSSSPRRVAISEAVKKAGRKAFKEMTQAPNKKLNDLLYAKRLAEIEKAPASDIQRINKEIDTIIGKQREQEDLEKTLSKYKSEPTVYIAKLLEAKQKSEVEAQKALLEKLDQQQNLFKSTLTAEQLLRTDETFSALPKTEQKLLTDYLKKATTRDTLGRREFAQQFISGDTTKKRALIQSILENEPIKAKGQIKDVSQDTLTKQMRSDAISRFRFKSSKQKQYVKEKLNMDNEATDSQSINDAIQNYMDEYTETEPKKTDVVFEEASKKQKRKDKKRQAMEQAEETSAELEAEDELATKTGNPFSVLVEEEPLRDKLAEQFLEDGITKDEAMQDAGEAIHKTREELERQLELSKKIPLPEELERRLEELSKKTPLPDYETTEKELTERAVLWALKFRKGRINENFSDEEDFKKQVELDPELAEQVRMDYVNSAIPAGIPQFNIKEGETRINKMSRAELLRMYDELRIPLPEGKDGNEPNLSELRNNLINIRKGFPASGKKAKGRGFKPITSYPPHLVAGTLAKHINNVRNSRFKQNIKKTSVSRDTENEEYRKGLKQNILRGGSLLSFLF